MVLFLLATTAVRAADTVLIFGDSLSAGYGIALDAAWPKLLQARLQEQGFNAEVVNASISGETTAGGRGRLAALLTQYRPRVLILELGGNDGLRGLPLRTIEANLKTMIEQARGAGAKVLVTGMKLPPNYGPYANAFSKIYPPLARGDDVVVVPFLLEGVGDNAELMQADGIHPRAEAQPRIVENIWPKLVPLLRK